jgi:hypothetical protein
MAGICSSCVAALIITAVACHRGCFLLTLLGVLLACLLHCCALQLAMSTLDRVVRGGLLIITAPELSVLHESDAQLVKDRNKAFYILDNITYLGSDLCQTAADRCRQGAHLPADKLCSSSANISTGDLHPQADLLSKVSGIGQLPAGSPCNITAAAAANGAAVDSRILRLGGAPILDFEHVLDFIHVVSKGLDSEKTCASFRDITLRGLPQGRGVPGSARGRNASIHWHPTRGLGRRLLTPQAAAAAAAAVAAGSGLHRRLQSHAGQVLGSQALTQATPDVWTIMMWSVTR